eukprot:TRINITY_DN103_c0_g1_i1.p1 TRINITY_DN103_c0_g1~~TRINITY_DN103_c0_g1_i1.p1  ORF type:complete len:253 (+),score=30.99 TRINITY_DN103_c0_g1_i1:71-760(+)
MATIFPSLTNTFLLPSCSSSSSSSTALIAPSLVGKRPNSPTVILCRAVYAPVTPWEILSRRSLGICFTTLTLSLAGKGFSVPDANAAILEADDDVELLEKVKQDRKKRLERQVVIDSTKKETGYLQELVYKLSRVAQAIDSNDLSIARSVLGSNTSTDWVKKANIAFTKLSSSPEEKIQVDTFNSSLASLISSVTKNDVKSSKMAFVSSANALEKWTALTGLGGLLKGL